MAITEVCCTCLSFDVKMFSLTDDDTRKCFENAINNNIKIELEDELLQNVCEQCVLIMQKFLKFKDKCLEANQILRQIISQSTYITETVLKAGTQKLCSQKITSFDHNPIFPDIKLCLGKEEEFSDKTASEFDSEITLGNSEFQTDLNNDVNFKNRPKLVEADPFVSHIQDDASQNDFNIHSSNNAKLENGQQLVKSDVQADSSYIVMVESIEVGNQNLQTHKNEKDLKNIRESPQDGKYEVPIEKNMLSVKKKQSLFKSNYVEQVTLTEEQQIEEFLNKRDTFKSDIDGPFKCSDCDQGFISKEKLEGHIKLHDENRGMWKCVICKLRYSTQSQLQFHQKSHSIRYKCLTCGELMRTLKQSKEHKKQHLVIKYKYNCQVCNEKFHRVKLYRRHTRTVHPNKYVCNLCGGLFKSQKLFEKHHTTKYCRESTKNFECNMCDSRFCKMNSFYGHMLRHSKQLEQAAPTECQICGQTTTSWTDWSHHFVDKHRIKNIDRDKSLHKKCSKTFICHDCGKSLRSKAILANHILTQHSGQTSASVYNKFIWKDSCKICNKTIQRDNMKRHMLIHTGEKPFKCDLCGDRFNQSNSRDLHVRNVHKVKDKPVVHRRKTILCEESKEEKKKPLRFQCSVCPKKFNSSHGLEDHDRSHTGIRPFSCDICQRTYSTKYTMLYHRNTHTGEKQYACDICNEKFTFKPALNSHKKVHTSQPVYACKVCDRHFKQPNNLKRHATVHSDVKNYTCELCGKSFRYTESLHLHVNTVHLNLPHPPRKRKIKRLFVH